MSVMTFFFGRALASDEQEHQKIGVFRGLPAMGLDGLASSAYGPEAALTILIPLGAVGLHYIGPLMGVILVIMGMLYLSYRQTIAAYPSGGGSYTVASENLGRWPGLLAAAALMLDYILNVAVGISSGVAALVSARPDLQKYTLWLCLGILVLITLVNLRGTSEAGLAWAIPTYLFLVSLMAVLAIGLSRAVTSGFHPHAVDVPPALPKATEAASLWILLRSFASGCTAMTGVEAVSNGVSAFKEPTVRTAHRTLTAICGLLALLLGGIALLCHAYHVGAMDQDQPGYQSVLSQLTAAVVGRHWFYYVTIASVLAVLCLSANTSFIGFPQLCRLIARDDYLPRSFAAVGRRLTYSVGILFLAGAAGVLLAAFKGITDRLIPLFAVGAFLAFTLSQLGMVMHWRRIIRHQKSDAEQGSDQPPAAASPAGAPPTRHNHLRLWINAIGGAATTGALAIILLAKFVEGAWIVVVAIPLLLATFYFINRHYRSVNRQVECEHPLDLSRNDPPVVLMPIRRWDQLTAKAVRLGIHMSRDVIAVHLNNLEGDAAEEASNALRQRWAVDVEAPARSFDFPVPRLDIVQTPYREFVKPLLEQIDRVKASCPHRIITVIIPEVVEKRWWLQVLHSRRASRLRNALRTRGDARVVVMDLPWFVEE